VRGFDDSGKDEGLGFTRNEENTLIAVSSFGTQPFCDAADSEGCNRKARRREGLETVQIE
jgi:hypothetical protein